MRRLRIPRACRPVLAWGIAGLALLAALPLNVRVLHAAEPSAEDLRFFESKVRPLLVNHCQKCHGPDKQKSNLRLDSLSAALAGGDSGAAVVPARPQDSLLVQAINYDGLEMPPAGKLPAADIAILTEWVKRGAPWPAASADAPLTPRKQGITVGDADREFWSFRPVERPAPPAVKNVAWGKNAIDAFILARLEARGLQPAGRATPRELIRRACFDLTGLPPTPEEVDQFAADASPDAYARLLDRLLDRPAYGERWGRHWLDVVRFAQTNGYERDDEKPNAWRYRDYVINAFNHDKPYDRFIREQLAGDELDDASDESVMATAFYRLGVWDDEPDDSQQAEFDELDDIVATTGTAFLGLTIGCARCHDHKFDPIPQEDYYGMLAFVRNIKRYAKPDKNSLGTIFAALQSGAQTLAVHEQGSTAPATHILHRGSADSPGKEVTPRFVQVLSPTAAAAIPQLPEKSVNGNSTGRRRVLADWIASPENPLTARVMANRLWHYHFGRGIVATPSDFGSTGLKPTHPELLDYLASELVAGGWRLKALHKQIMLSAAYQQSSRIDNPQAVEADPGNTLIWRQNLRRLEAEAIRDAILATNGQLNRAMGGRGIFPALSAEVLSTQSRPGNGWDKSSDAERARRSVYIFVKRTLGVPMMDTFDAASPDTSTATRATTTIAPQALILLNSQFMDEEAAIFARRLRAEAGDDGPACVERAFRLALGRSATSSETQTALAYVARQQSALKKESPPPVPEPPMPALLAGWSYFGGHWTLRDDGGYQVEPEPGAKVVWDEPVLDDGTVSCQVRMLAAGGDAGLTLRVNDATKGVDALAAYNINFLVNRLRLGKHEQNWRELTSVPLDLSVDRWHDVKVALEGNRIRIFVDGADQPQIDYTDPSPLKPGRVGFRTFQAKTAFRNLKVESGGRMWVAGMKLVEASSRSTVAVTAEARAREQALASFCKLLLNLNEFVYVD